MSIVVSIILILASIVLIAVVLMQDGNKQGLGVIGGAAETFMGKSKAKTDKRDEDEIDRSLSSHDQGDGEIRND